MVGGLGKAFEDRLERKPCVGSSGCVNEVLQDGDAPHEIYPILHHRLIARLRAHALQQRRWIVGGMLEGELKPRERILSNGLVQTGNADAQWSSHVASYPCTSAVALPPASRAAGAALVVMTDDIRIIRAGVTNAATIAEFLHRQDVRPAPRVDDVEMLCRRSDASLFCALRDGQIAGVAACMQDGPVLHIAYFAVAADSENEPANALVQALEARARQLGATLLAAQAVCDSPTHRCLVRLGFSVEWEERDRLRDRAVTVVDLLRPL
ncbi:MAG: GNAT family N-acetyltransferase [Candidatus Eremiobacteraeota bacterium]|nr:GNAT family N-acetyltransferase [Candidatus Eremiobacteraeota bacterium]